MTYARPGVETIREQLERFSTITVDRNGTEFLIGEDEEGNGWYAWRTPAHDGAESDKAFDAGVSYPNGMLAVGDFLELAEEIAEWIEGAYP